MRSMSSREKKIFITLVGLLAIFVLYRLVFLPLHDRSTELVEELQKQKRRLHKNLKIVKKKKIITEEYQMLVEAFKQKDSDEKEMSGIIANLESVTRRMNLQFSEMKPGKIVEEDFYKVFSVSLKLEGYLEQAVHFLYILQKEPHFFRIKELRLERRAQKNSRLIIRLVLSRIFIPEKSS